MKVLLVTYRRADLLGRCISQLSSYFDTCDVMVVDNQSEESAAIATYCETHGISLIQNDRNEGFAKAVNMGMRRIREQSADSWVLLLNTDADLLMDPQELTRFADVNTACITTFDAAANSPWDCEKPIPNPWRAAWEDSGLGRIRISQPFGSRYRSFSEGHKGFLAGCFLIVSTAAWEQVGEFDERFWLYSEETDWCLRVYKSGLDCLVVPILGYGHQNHGGQSVIGDPVAEELSKNEYQKSRTAFIEKHWGRRGLYAYTLILSSLLHCRSFAGVGRRLCRGRT